MTFSTIGIDGTLNEQPDPRTGKNKLVFTPTKDAAGNTLSVSINKSARPHGVYIIGRQGTGKSGLIENLIVQDIKQGLGVCVLDPHGELIDHVISRLDARREKDVMLLDIRDYHYPFGLNPFACDDPRNPLAVQEVVDRVLHVFEKLLGVTHETPLILDYLRKCTYTLVANPGFTMAEIPLLLTDKTFRQQLIANVTDTDVLLFWKEYDQKSPTDQATERAGILRRVGEFLQSVSRPIVGQEQSTIDFTKVMDESKILLVKLDSLRLFSVTNLIGSFMIAAFLTAAPTRTKRQNLFNIYADEFQRFATEDFATLLEEARKFGIGITIAHQNRAQLELSDKQAEKELKKRVLNVGSLIVFCVPTDAVELAGQFDCTPPAPDIVGYRPILTPKQDVLDHLKKNGHVHPQVSQFLSDYLIPMLRTLENNKRTYYPILVSLGQGQPRRKVQMSDLDEACNQLNTFLFSIMRDRDAHKPLPPFVVYQFARLFGFSQGFAWYFTRRSFWTTYELPSIFFPRQPLLLLCDPDFLLHNNQIAQTISPNVLSSAFGFMTSFRLTMQVLADDPILIDTGQHEPIYDKPRSYQDVQNEIANQLVGLPDFMARVRIKDDTEHLIQTLKPEKGLYGKALQERIERIRKQNITDGYIKDRATVEDEIIKRQSQWKQKAQQPQGRKMLLCQKCGVQNRQDAKFCNQCGSSV